MIYSIALSSLHNCTDLSLSQANLAHRKNSRLIFSVFIFHHKNESLYQVKQAHGLPIAKLVLNLHFKYLIVLMYPSQNISFKYLSEYDRARRVPTGPVRLRSGFHALVLITFYVSWDAEKGINK